MDSVTCMHCGAKYLAGHRGPSPKCGTAEEWAALNLFEARSPGPRPEWEAVLAPIENPTTEEEYLINLRALSAALKEAKRRREAGEPRRPVDLHAELGYATSATGYLDPVTFRRDRQAVRRIVQLNRHA